MRSCWVRASAASSAAVASMRTGTVALVGTSSVSHNSLEVLVKQFPRQSMSRLGLSRPGGRPGVRGRARLDGGHHAQRTGSPAVTHAAIVDGLPPKRGAAVVVEVHVAEVAAERSLGHHECKALGQFTGAARSVTGLGAPQREGGRSWGSGEA